MYWNKTFTVEDKLKITVIEYVNKIFTSTDNYIVRMT